MTHNDMQTEEYQRGMCERLGKSGFIELMRRWIAQRPGLDSGNYDRGIGVFSDYKKISEARHRAKAALNVADGREWDPAEMARALRSGYNGRLSLTADYNDPTKIVFDYCVGRYWPTEYREAAASVLKTYNNATEPEYDGERFTSPEWDVLQDWTLGETYHNDSFEELVYRTEIKADGSDVFFVVKESLWGGKTDLWVTPARGMGEANRIKAWIKGRHDGKCTIEKRWPVNRTDGEVKLALNTRYYALSMTPLRYVDMADFCIAKGISVQINASYVGEKIYPTQLTFAAAVGRAYCDLKGGEDGKLPYTPPHRVDDVKSMGVEDSIGGSELPDPQPEV